MEPVYNPSVESSVSQYSSDDEDSPTVPNFPIQFEIDPFAPSPRAIHHISPQNSQRSQNSRYIRQSRSTSSAHSAARASSIHTITASNNAQDDLTYGLQSFLNSPDRIFVLDDCDQFQNQRKIIQNRNNDIGRTDIIKHNLSPPLPVPPKSKARATASLQTHRIAGGQNGPQGVGKGLGRTSSLNDSFLFQNNEQLHEVAVRFERVVQDRKRFDEASDRYSIGGVSSTVATVGKNVMEERRRGRSESIYEKGERQALFTTTRFHPRKEIVDTNVERFQQTRPQQNGHERNEGENEYLNIGIGVLTLCLFPSLVIFTFSIILSFHPLTLVSGLETNPVLFNVLISAIALGLSPLKYLQYLQASPSKLRVLWGVIVLQRVFGPASLLIYRDEVITQLTGVKGWCIVLLFLSLLCIADSFRFFTFKLIPSPTSALTMFTSTLSPPEPIFSKHSSKHSTPIPISTPTPTFPSTRTNIPFTPPPSSPNRAFRISIWASLSLIPLTLYIAMAFLLHFDLIDISFDIPNSVPDAKMETVILLVQSAYITGVSGAFLIVEGAMKGVGWFGVARTVSLTILVGLVVLDEIEPGKDDDGVKGRMQFVTNLWIALTAAVVGILGGLIEWMCVAWWRRKRSYRAGEP